MIRPSPLFFLFVACACTPAEPSSSSSSGCSSCSPAAGDDLGPCLPAPRPGAARACNGSDSFCVEYLDGGVCAPACPACPACGDLQTECVLSGACMAVCASDADCLAGQKCSYDGDLAPHACVWP